MQYTIRGGDSKVLNNVMYELAHLNPEKVWEVDIREFRPKRSIAQNNLYWKWMQEIAEQAVDEDGNKLDKGHWHYLCGLNFLGISTIKEKNGVVFAVPTKSTKKLKVKEFTEYLMNIEAEFTGRGVKLTFPDDYGLAMGMERA